jgi:D-alanyl-D-alanine carboxypeptidase
MIYNHKICIGFIATTAAMLAAGGVTLAETSGSGFSIASADADLDRALRKLVAMPGGPPGVIAIVQRGEDRRVHRFGVADLSDNARMRINDHMRVASVAKAFSGAAALSLVSKEILSLDDTIGKHLPDLPKWSEVTLRQLLGHTSGLPDFSESDDFLAAVRASPKKPLAPRELLSFVENKPPKFTPGSRYKYSNTDNIVVGLMIAAATGRTYERELKAQVFRPLGLERTSLPMGARLPEPFIHGYDNAVSHLPPEDLSEIIAAGWAWASGGVVSSPADLNEFIRGYVGGALFDSQTQAEQRKVVEGGGSEPPGPGENAAGLAIFRYVTRCGTVWGHTGNTPGYTQFAAASPDGRNSVTVSINEQLSVTQGVPGALAALREAEELGVCAALAD